MYTTCEKKDDTKIRNNSYYNTESTFDELYKKSQQGYNFYKLMEIIVSENNLKLAYRNIKKNTGSYTAGCDGIAIQQAILQVMEPIAEAKFHPNSNGFRPLKSCETAMAQTMKRIQLQKLYYVVDFDMKGFFDNVNHNKLMSQLWNKEVFFVRYKNRMMKMNFFSLSIDIIQL